MKNPGLKANVISMYKSYFQREGFFRPKIEEDLKIQGKLKEHTVDIYFEFVQMNNLERAIIKIVEDTEVTDNDIWEFRNVLKDLHFFAKGILYYNGNACSNVKKAAEQANIDLKKFVFCREIQKSVMHFINTMLPNEEVIGDPFWVIMEISQDSGANTGNYDMVNNSILLFLSKKQASRYCSKRKKNARVFGISQNHLEVLVSLQERGLCPDFSIAFPEFEQIYNDSLIYYQISKEKFKKFYLRGNNNA
ncbi:hypothetical protein [uncultured Neglectibacter sp.]|uniref:hypothetical protein n=1 Tax=uncultured Neglectibacter sp. TaxID=1924108 RepID=UPI0034DF3DC0